jgi:hypothetical protein
MNTDTTHSKQSLKTPFMVIFISLWFVSSGSLLMKIFHVFPDRELFITIMVQVIGLGYIGMLIWYFSHTPPTAAELPDLLPPISQKFNFWGVLCFIIAILIFLFSIGIVAHPQLVIVVVMALLGFYLTFRWKKLVTFQMLFFGIGIGILSFFPGLLNRDANIYSVIGYLICPIFLSIGGALLLEYTHLTHIRILENSPSIALRSFGWGCVLAIPPALLNIIYGAHKGDKGIDKWFDPLAALTPGIAEEVWARLFLTTLCYALLRPTTNNRPSRALIAAILIGAITHGLAHLQTQMILSHATLGCIFAGLLFGVPMGLLFVKRDLEQAVAYHFFIDFTRYLAAYLL